MKIILIISSLFIYGFGYSYICEIKKLELTIYDLYQNEFSRYLIITNEDILSYDKEELKHDIEDKGYKVEFFDEEELHFYISFKKIFVYQKEFRFELVKNDEY